MVRMSGCEYNDTSFVQLSPFIHQVGGHSSLFQYSKSTICKLLVSHELEFYQSVPEKLKEFIPEFRGIVTVNCSKDKQGCIQLIAKRNPTLFDTESSNEQYGSILNNELQSSDNILRPSVPLRCLEDGSVDYLNIVSNDIINYEKGKIIQSPIHPWGVQLGKKQAEKLHQQLIDDENRKFSEKYILLENVTAQFQNPCVLDLKMGIRQHTDIDSDKKRQSKIKKCELSTSSKLGVRLCGMQVYQVISGSYICVDKYRGRTMTISEFHNSLAQYLDNGCQKRFDILPEIIERLESLHVIINSLLTYRFYSGSLLIVYDGSSQSKKIDVRMIDFANTTCDTKTSDDSNESSSAHSGPDLGYLCGLKHLIEIFRKILGGNENFEEQVPQ